MAKVERLMQLSNLIKKREAISVKEMSRACGVSQRTIYRYLNTLSKLGSPDYGFDGGVLEDRRDDIWSGLDASDLDMIDYILRHNPLTRFPFFMERLSKVRRRVQDGRRHLDKGSSCFVLAEDEFDEAREMGQNDVLERFTRAKLDARKVAITVRGSDSRPRNLIPVAVKISRAGVALMVSDHLGDTPTEISLTDISRLVVSAEAVKDGAERAVGKTGPPTAKTS